MDQEKLDELAERRRVAGAGEEWDGVQKWIVRSYELLSPGGVLAQVLPDGKPFTVTKPKE